MRKSGITSKSKSEKVVSFNQSVMVFPVRHRADYTEKDAKAVWYSDSEQKSIMSSVYSSLKKMEQGSHLTREDENFCSRGLKICTSVEMTHKRRKRDDAINAVLDTQNLQKHKYGRVRDPQAIANAYSSLCQKSARIARVMGIADQHFLHLSYPGHRETIAATKSSNRTANRSAQLDQCPLMRRYASLAA